MPGFAFPAAGPLGLSSPPYRTGIYCPVPRYYAPLRLPTALLGSLRLSLASRYLNCSQCLCPVSGSLQGESYPYNARALGQPVPLVFRLILGKETVGSPKFPSCPYECMPRSQTPVVS